MEKFIVSARKYRPQNFNTVVGQAHITTTLKNAIKNNHLAHAFLFCGPRGVGKTTCARILAKTINCLAPSPEGEACNHCTSCVSFDAGASFNIHELDAASNNSVDDIRSLVEQVRFAPQSGRYKVYIIDEVHMLSQSAFNAFLKTLEEPPSYAIFILATTEKHKILPTILSRCQIFDFKRIVPNDTVKHLVEITTKENIRTEDAALQVIAQKSEGCMRDALSILDKIVSFTNGELTYKNTIEHLNILDHDYYFQMLDAIHAKDLGQLMLLYEEIDQKGFEGDLVLNGFAGFLRNVLVCKEPKAASLLEDVVGAKDRYLAASGKTSLSFLVSALNVLNETEIQYKMARNRRLHVEMALIKLNFLQDAIELSLGTGGNVQRKRSMDKPIPIRYEKVPQLNPLQGIAVKKTESKLFIETQPSTVQTKPATSVPQAKAQPLPAHLSEPTPPPYKGPEAPVAGTKAPEPKKGPINKGSLLEQLKAKVGNKYEIQEVVDPTPLQIDALNEIWTAMIRKMESEGKNAQANSFSSARLEVVDEIKFNVYVHSQMQLRFIEQEKQDLLVKLQARFNSRAVTFDFVMEESTNEAQQVKPVQMSSKQRYEWMAAHYPMVAMLRETLKLEIEF